MKREEPRTGRIADFEFQFWECWESGDNVAGAIERHWFRSDTGLEAPTYDHMLQKLYRQKMGLPVVPQMPSEPQRSATSEWDKRTPCVVQVNGKEIVIEICEHYTEATGGAPVSTKFVGPNGLVTSTYPEMLERLGVAGERQQSALRTQQSAKAESRQSALGSQHSAKAKMSHSRMGSDEIEHSGTSHDANATCDTGGSSADAVPQHAAAMIGVSEAHAGSPAQQTQRPALSYIQRLRHIRVGDRDVEVTEYEYLSPSDSKLILSRKFVAPDGTETSTYREMLEKLGGRPRPYLPEDEHRPASPSEQAIKSPQKADIPEMELTGKPRRRAIQQTQRRIRNLLQSNLLQKTRLRLPMANRRN